MTAPCRQIGELVTRIQEAYLEMPGLALTLDEARRRFRIDLATCRALFDLFLETGVLKTGRDGYRLRQPARPVGSAGRTAPGAISGGPRRGVRLRAAA